MPLDNGPRYGGHGSFNKRLQYGGKGEDVVTTWARRLGFWPVRLADLPASTKAGPRLRGPEDCVLLAPDLLLLRDGVALLLEVKRKTAFTLHHDSGDWVTGIEAGYFAKYLRVWNALGIPTFLGFLHDDDACQHVVGGEVWKLAKCIHHRHISGAVEMIYWDRRRLGDLAEHPAFALPDPNDGMCRDYEPPPDDEQEPERPKPSGKRTPPDFNFGG